MDAPSEPKINNGIKRKPDPLQEFGVHNLGQSHNLKQAWFRTAPETRLAIAVLAVAPLVLACVAVAAAVTR